MSYVFGTEGILKAPGFWDQELNWHAHPFRPQELIFNELFTSLK